MKTLTLNIQDSFLDDFLSMIEKYSDKIQIQKDKNLIQDPYFYERQKRLHQLRDDVMNGKMKMLSADEFDNSMQVFFNELENRA